MLISVRNLVGASGYGFIVCLTRQAHDAFVKSECKGTKKSSQFTVHSSQLHFLYIFLTNY